MPDWHTYCSSSLWDHQLSWNTTSPRLTLCFRQTVLEWLPPLYLIAFGPILIYSLIRSKEKTRTINSGWNAYNIARQALSVASVIVTLADLIIVATRASDGEQTLFEDKLDIINAVMHFLLSTTVSILFYLFMKRATVTSGIMWTYLGVSSICLSIKLVSTFLERRFGARADIGPVINGSLTWLLFLLSFWADPAGSHRSKFEKREKKDKETTRKECPKDSSSFFSRLTYSWYSSLTYIGWGRSIVLEDVWAIRTIDSALYHYESYRKCYDSFKERYIRKQKEQRNNGGSTARPFRISVLRIIWSSMSGYFVSGSSFKLFNDIFIFINPIVMKKLMTFVGDHSDPTWHGYVYVFAMFALSAGQILALNYYFNRMTTFGMRIRTQLTTAIYRKALKLSSSARSKFTTGEIVNLMSVDAQRFLFLTSFINILWSGPFQILLGLYFLYTELGVSVFAGFTLLIVLIPLNMFILSTLRKMQVTQMKLKDERVKATNEILSGMKIIKLYGWEKAFIERVNLIRNKELSVLRRLNYLSCAFQAIWVTAPFLVSFSSFAIYVLSDSSNVLTAQKAFYALALFNIIRFPMGMLPNLLTTIVTSMVSVKRLNNFLNAGELTNYIEPSKDEENCIELENCTFGWSKVEDTFGDGKKKTKEEKKMEKKNAKKVKKEESVPEEFLKKISFRVKKNSFVAIVGSVGAGKSSLLNAMLGNMELISGTIKLTSSMRIAYTPQEAWIQNSSLRDNILFGIPFNEDYYKSIVYSCSLVPDFEILPGGDQTEIGEKGINLSGGQKQRVSLARACFNDADIYLLDDPLSAVDSHVGKHIFEHILDSETGILRNKTRVLVTNALNVLPYTDSIIVLDNGQLIEHGSFNELMEKNGHLANLVQQYSNNKNEETEDSEETTEEKKGKDNNKLDFKINKLMEKEEAQEGRVKMNVYFRYFKAISIFWGVVFTSSYILANMSMAFSSIWLSEWSRNAETDNPHSPVYYLIIYGTVGITQGMFGAFGWYAMTKGMLKAAFTLHNNMLVTILRSPMAFFDVTPLGRILNRFSKDIDVCDNTIQDNIRILYQCLFGTVSTLVIISINMSIFLTVIVPVAIGFYLIQKMYVSTARQLKRLESVTKSPVYTHFSETLTGVATIRAYNANDQFIARSDESIDINNSCYYASIVSNRWLSIRLEMVANAIVLFAGLFSVIYREKMDASSVGLIITYALSTTQNLTYLVRAISDIETNIVGIERVLEYTDLKTEADWIIEANKPSSTWPSDGQINFANYSTRYRPGLDLVLRGLNVIIRPGDKIGIVGRTGAGKTSITLALFRLIEPSDGTIKIDSIDITQTGLHQLRQRLTIIPQDPVLFAGTIRFNLDPFDDYSDEKLWECLELAHLKTFVKSLDEGLSHTISEGGGNLSVGQRQLICLGRALLRNTQVLVLDEATAAVDLRSDALIQKTIRDAFAKCTILTIAHRLNTILDSDRVIVLDEGKVREYDSPENLLADSNSIFYSMAEAAGLTAQSQKPAVLDNVSD